MAISTALPQTKTTPATSGVDPLHLTLENDPRTESENRYERKFAIYDLDLPQVEMVLMLNPAAFTSIYKPRYINNIYLDTPQRHSFHQTVAGSTPRKKVRIRWYGELKGLIPNPVLEFKIKKGLTGYKITLPLSSFTLEDTFSRTDLDALIKKSLIPGDIRQQLDLLEPALLNRYHRSYYLSGSKNIRATVDTNLIFHDIFSSTSPLLGRSARDCVTVVETKYAPEKDREAAAIASAFPFRLTKFSKYVMGIEQINA